MNVAVVGAHTSPEKYSNMAVRMLVENGHTVFPVHPALDEVEGLRVFKSVADIPDEIDTVTLYVGPAVSSKTADSILSKKPRRIIFNPGAENPELAVQAKRRRIETVEGCTLVMLRTHQF